MTMLSEEERNTVDRSRLFAYGGDTARLIAIIDRLTGQSPAAEVKGWVMVPKEPTKEMLLAADTYFVACNKAKVFVNESGMYQAMLAAAPSPPTQPEIAEKCRGLALRLKAQAKINLCETDWRITCNKFADALLAIVGPT